VESTAVDPKRLLVAATRILENETVKFMPNPRGTFIRRAESCAKPEFSTGYKTLDFRGTRACIFASQ
jgi:hypothetical protein